MFIRSYQNLKIKNVIKLIKKSRERKKQNCFVVEGKKENQLAIINKFHPIEFFICPVIYLVNIKSSAKIYQISKPLYKKIAFRGTTEGIIGIYKIPTINNNIPLSLSLNSTVIILESIEKCGNLGAVLRNCDAFSVDLLIICDQKTDIFNPNVIRSSIGCIFTIPVYIMNKKQCLKFCLENKIKIFTTFISSNQVSRFYDIKFNCSVAIVFGSENKGVDLFWRKFANANIYIPMLGQINSLNVSNTVSIILYEIAKQKYKNLKV